MGASHGTDATIKKIVQYTPPENIEKRTKTEYVEPIQAQKTNNSKQYENTSSTDEHNTQNRTRRIRTPIRRNSNNHKKIKKDPQTICKSPRSTTISRMA